MRQLLLIALLLTASVLAAEEPLRFNRDVRPILSKHCFACHGPDAEHREAELRLDDREAAVEAGAVVPGNVAKSSLVDRIHATDPDTVMPPPSTKKSLTAEEKRILVRWIAEGAEYEAHWAFVAPREPKVPAVDGVRNPIDAFLEDRIRRERLAPAGEASKETLIRRATLDLTGLPPTPQEVDAFLADDRPDAWERLLDELMSRESHGEHQARYWLDLARYADTHGLHLDNERSMWPYRDWVVRAYNENVPFDDFTRWQLAGDLLPEATLDQRIATGFNRCNVTTGEGGSINEEWIYRYAVDRTSTTAEVWLGLTAGCAVCHDHKFDPLSTKEYYSMYAFFHSAADPAMDGNRIDTPPVMRVVQPAEQQRLVELDTEIAAVGERIATAVAAVDYTDPATLDPTPEPRKTTDVWFEDGFPKGTTPRATGPALQLVAKDDAPVFAGSRAIKRTATDAIGQDFYQGGATFSVPEDGRFFVHCRFDEDDPPQTLMLQFHVGGWNHRAVWGSYDAIPWGKADTHERVHVGDLPEAGAWQRLEFDAKALGLGPGTKIDGFSFTQFGGTVWWDHFGVESTVDPATNVWWSWQRWTELDEKTRTRTLPDGLRQRVRGKRPEAWSDAEREALRRHWLENVYAGSGPELEALKSEKAGLVAEKSKIVASAPVTMVMADLPTPRKSFVMLRGQYDKPGEPVARNVPAFLPGLPPRPAGRDYNRLDLANWLVSGEHPLTARVAVNRTWQQFFGTGLVKTSSDFGTQGELPSHPELLDWLALRFVEDGWDNRKLMKRILTSRAYRRSSAVTPELLERDPDNRLLARGPRFQLAPEVLRDQALHTSGLLVQRLGGKGVRPYQPPNIWEPVAFGGSNTRFYKRGTGDDLYRRSLYTFFKRTAPPPFLSNFGAPNREQSCPVRSRSSTPLQALQLMNDVQHVEAARNLAQRILVEGGEDDTARIRWGWRVVTARWPDDGEVEVVRTLLESRRRRFAENTEAAAKLVAYGDSKPDGTIPVPELASWTLVANLMLNLDEVVTKN